MKKPKRKPQWVPLVNNKGELKLTVRDDITIGELYDQGLKKIKFTPKDKPLPKGWLTPK